jgi:hypothetical protein
MGDLTGVSIEIDVPEIDITALKVGMPAIVRGVALGKEALQGTLVAINAQASTTNNTSLPTFTANVEVKHLSPTQQDVIKVGMSATVELTMNSTNKLLIPVAAIYLQNGKNFVQRHTSDGQIIEQPIITGAVHDKQVIVESGLKLGDEIIIP